MTKCGSISWMFANVCLSEACCFANHFALFQHNRFLTTARIAHQKICTNILCSASTNLINLSFSCLDHKGAQETGDQFQSETKLVFWKSISRYISSLFHWLHLEKPQPQMINVFWIWFVLCGKVDFYTKYFGSLVFIINFNNQSGFI